MQNIATTGGSATETTVGTGNVLALNGSLTANPLTLDLYDHLDTGYILSNDSNFQVKVQSLDLCVTEPDGNTTSTPAYFPPAPASPVALVPHASQTVSRTSSTFGTVTGQYTLKASYTTIGDPTHGGGATADYKLAAGQTQQVSVMVGPWVLLGSENNSIIQSAPASGPHLAITSKVGLLIHGSDNQLWYREAAQGQWKGWRALGGTVILDPCLVSASPGTFDAFALGSGRDLLHFTYDGQNWSGSQSLGGNLLSSPTAVSCGAGRIDIFAKGRDQSLQHLKFENNQWGSWETIGGPLTGPYQHLASSTPLDIGGNVPVYVNSGSQSIKPINPPPADPNFLSSTAPSVVAVQPGQLDVFVRGNDNALWHIWFYGGTWGAWESLGGQLCGEPGVAPKMTGVFNNKFSVFAAGSGNVMTHAELTQVGDPGEGFVTPSWKTEGNWQINGRPVVMGQPNGTGTLVGARNTSNSLSVGIFNQPGSYLHPAPPDFFKTINRPTFSDPALALYPSGYPPYLAVRATGGKIIFVNAIFQGL